MRTLRRVAATRGGAGFPHHEQGLDSGELPFIKVSDFNHPGNERTITHCSNWVSRVTARRLGASVVPGGALLMPKIGAAMLGNARRLTSQPSVFDNNVLAVVPTGINSRYLQYWLSTIDTAAFAKPGPIPSMGDDVLLDLEVPVDEVAEQRAIADYLDAETARIDTLIAKKQQLIHLLEERWVALRNNLILRSVDPVSGHGALPEGWSCPQLGVLIELQRGHDLPSDAREDGPFPIVSSGGISGYHVKSACQAPAVVTGRYGTVGEVYFVEEDCWPLNTTLYVKDFRGNDPRWVAFMLESLPLDAESEKSAVGGINRNVIGKLRVPRPGLGSQKRIAAELLQARPLQEAATQAIVLQLDLLAEHRQALLTAAVTGEFVVPGAA